MEAIINFFSNILSALFSSLFKTREPTEFDKQYEKLRFDVASALTMYARYYHYPVDIAKQPDGKLPPEYENASIELRKLGSTASALAAIIPAKGKKQIEKKKKLEDASGCLIGLSNSMNTPYNCAFTSEDRRNVKGIELEIRKNLQLGENN